MKKKSHVPSFSTIITTDYPSFLASLGPVLVFLIYLGFVFARSKLTRPILPQVIKVVDVVMIGLTLILLIYLVYRVWIVRRVFQHGSEVQGRVSAVTFRRVAGWVAYSYSFGQKRINSGAALRRNLHTRVLHKGDRVVVVVDRNDPKRAFIREAFR